MATRIRLRRVGRKKLPLYRSVVAEKTAPRDGRFIEKIGSYDPMKAKDAADRVVLDAEKVQAWLAKGAQPTDQVDISAAAEAAMNTSEGGDFRADLVARVRSEIAAGTYETPQKLAMSMDALLDEIG